MNKTILFAFIIIASSCLLGCASSIVDGEHMKTSSISFPPKSNTDAVDVYLSEKEPQRETIDIGIVTSRAWVLETGINELKTQARKLGADAIVHVVYERKFSADYLQDLYFINGEAVVWK